MPSDISWGLVAAATGGIGLGYLLGRQQTRSDPVQVAAPEPPAAAQQPVGQKMAVVTGGSRGIGAAVCKMLGKQGYKVVVNFRSNKAAADAVVSEITGAGGAAVAIKADVAVEADCRRLFAEAERKLGCQVTHLVNNAAIIGPRTGLLDADAATQLEQLLAVFRPNVLGSLACCREAARRMSTQNGGKGGSIVNVSSGSAFMGTPLLYAMSKGALNSMQAGLVKELAAHGVRVNSVSPGMTKTDMVPDDVLAANVAAIPLKRGAEPHEIAAVICFLLGDGASYTSGANIRVGGGRPMGGAQ